MPSLLQGITGVATKDPNMLIGAFNTNKPETYTSKYCTEQMALKTQAGVSPGAMQIYQVKSSDICFVATAVLDAAPYCYFPTVKFLGPTLNSAPGFIWIPTLEMNDKQGYSVPQVNDMIAANPCPN